MVIPKCMKGKLFDLIKMFKVNEGLWSHMGQLNENMETQIQMKLNQD